MPEQPRPAGAVFLSYASQDAEAARRICDMLRAAGVEVWFDRSELVGGDAWDAKIRRQISSCGLFVPVISANTQARLEGYFRLEWKLAAQRTHTMADERTFLLPVVIDDTRDAEAKVPAEFKAVQWTRLPGGENAAAFTARVKNLLGGEVAPVSDRRSGEAPRPDAGHRPALLRKPWLVPAILGIFTVSGLTVWLTRNPIPAPQTAVAASPAEALVAKARALLDDDPLMTRANVELAEQLSLQAIAKDQTDGEAYAVAAWANFRFLEGNYEDTPQRRADLRTYAEKARLLAPDSINAELAMAGVLLATNNRPEAVVRLRALADRAPGNLTVLRAYAGAAPWGNGVNWGDDEKSDPAALARLRAHSPLGRAYADSLLANQHWAKGEYVEAERVLEAIFASGHPVRLTYLLRLLVLTYGWGDLPAARDFSATLPAKLLLEDVFITHVTNVWLYSGDHDKALATLDRTQREMLQEAKIMIPTALFRGEVLAAAGRPAAAAIQWRTALGLVDKLLAGSPGNPMLHLHRMNLLIRLGNREGAAAEFGVVMEIIHPVAGSVSWGRGYEYYALIGEVGKAIPRIDRLIARDNGRWPNDYNNLRYEPVLAGLRKDPRVQAIMARGAGWLAEMRRGATAEQPQTGLPPLPDNKSVAVLAFANLSDDKTNEYFSDGISEELLNVLAKVPGLKVSARTSAFYFKGKEVPIPEIARQLGVAYVVEGSVRKAGGKVRITAQLIKAADGFHVWSDTFTRDLKDIFAVQDEIAGLIAKNLEVKMGMTAARPTIDVEAYQEYLTGRALVARAGNDDLRQAVGHFEKTVAIAPKFTAAWVQLASTHTQLGRWGGAPTLQAWAAARAAIDKARALEPDSPDVLLALGWILRTGEWDWHGAEAAFRRALQLRPDHPETLAGAAVLLYNIGQDAEAFRLGEQAVRLDPLNPSTQLDLSIMFYLIDKFPEGERLARRALALAPGGAGYHSILGWSLMGAGRYDEAVAEANADSDEVQQASILGLVAVARGQETAARAQIARMEAIARTDPARADLQLTIAWISAGLGDKDRAFASLEKARSSRDPSVSWLRNGSQLRALFSDARWGALLHSVGLADDQLK